MNIYSCQNLIKFFDAAAERLKNPKLIVKLALDKVVIARASTSGNSKYPGCLHISDGGGFGYNRYYGRINRDGTTVWRMDTSEQLKQLITKINADPVAEAKLQGQQFGHCMFCGIELVTKQSVHAGYGPVCADKWGLPWGETGEQQKKVSKKLSPIDQLDLGL